MANLIKSVEEFWDKNPLFTGEEIFEREDVNEFFLKHDQVYHSDVLSGINFERTFFLPSSDNKTLDLGCGIGFWSALFAKELNVKNLFCGDLSKNSLKICGLRVPKAKLLKLNAEKLCLEDNSFDFINCQGVVHHTPNTNKCIDEIYRVLKFGGRASISVYYENIPLKIADSFLPAVNWFSKKFLKNLGRGRSFDKATSKEDLVRLYDGSKNPLGKCFSKKQFYQMLKDSGFKDIEIKFFFFPFRFFTIKIPNFVRPLLVKTMPFMIVANVRKT